MRHRLAVTILSLAAGSFFSACAQAEPEEASTGGPEISAAIMPVAPAAPAVLHGKATVDVLQWDRDYQAGIKALKSERFAEAEARLSAAWHELHKRNLRDNRVAMTRLALGEAQLALNKVDEANSNFAAVLAIFRQQSNSEPLQHLRALNGGARTALELHKWSRAQQLSEQAMDLCSGMTEKPGLEVLTAWTNRGIVLLKNSQVEEAATQLSAVLQYLEASPGNKDLLQEVLYNLGLAYARQGDTAKAEPYFTRAFTLKEEKVVFDRTARQAGAVNMVWEDGSPRSRQMWDPEYPLKYVHLKGIRVASTIVRSENLVSVLISIANCGRDRVQVGVGDVRLQMLSPGKKYLTWIDGNILDRTLEEDHVNNLTWRRLWLAHIQKTRRIPGYLKDGALNTDNFFGNNVFGPYGHWPVMAHTEPAVVTREQFYFDAESGESPVTKPVTAFANKASAALKPTFLDPGDARTGIVFFQRERFDAARLQIVLGNTVFEFPFSAPGGPSGRH